MEGTCFEVRPKTISMKTPEGKQEAYKQIKRRQTGFVRPDDLEKIHVFNKTSSEMLLDEEDDDSAHVRISPGAAMTAPGGARHARRPTGFVRASDLAMFDDDEDDDNDVDEQRPSVLTRLLDDSAVEDQGPGPTLKDYKPISETLQNNALFLRTSLSHRVTSDDNLRKKFIRHSISDYNEKSIDHVLNLQHGVKANRKISTDYVKTIDYMEHKMENSIRSVEFAKTRPAISVVEYQKKNQQYLQDQLTKANVSEKNQADALYLGGLRLPGDTPLFCSLVDVRSM